MTGFVLSSLIVLAGGFAQGCLGFGFALVVAPSLMLLYPSAQTAVPIAALVGTVSTTLAAFSARRHIQFGIVGLLTLGAAIGVPIGVFALKTVPTDALKVCAGILVIAFAALLLAGWSKPIRQPRLALVIVGALSGCLAGSTSMGGPPAVLFLTNQGTPKHTFRASLLTFFLIAGCLTLTIFCFSKLVTREVLINGLALAPSMLVGTVLGILLSQRLPEQLFRRFVLVALIIIGLTLVGTSVLR